MRLNDCDSMRDMQEKKLASKRVLTVAAALVLAVTTSPDGELSPLVSSFDTQIFKVSL